MPGQDQIHYKLDAHRLVYRIITYKILKCSRENVSIVTFPHGGRTDKVNYRVTSLLKIIHFIMIRKADTMHS